MEKNITERQRRFISGYIKNGGNATQAAIDANYSERSARQVASVLLTNPNVRAEMERQIDEIKSRDVADVREVIEFWTAILRGEVTEEQIVNVGTGKGFTNPERLRVEITIKDRLKASELLAKVYGAFVQKSEVSISGDAVPIILLDDVKE